VHMCESLTERSATLSHTWSMISSFARALSWAVRSASEVTNLQAVSDEGVGMSEQGV
jgi:fructose-bisphosphate aldolase class 1